MSANVIVDIVLAAVAALIIIKFTVTGFLKSVLDTLKVLFAAVVAYVVRIPMARLIDGWFMNEAIVGGVRNSLMKCVEGNDTLFNFIDLYRSIPGFFNSILAKFGLGDVSGLENLEGDEALVDGLAMEIGSAVSLLLSTIVAVIAMFLILLIVFSILVKVFDALTHIKAVNVINKLLGFVLGVAVAILALRLGVAIVELLVKWTNGFGGSLTAEMLNNSMLVGLVKLVI